MRDLNEPSLTVGLLPRNRGAEVSRVLFSMTSDLQNQQWAVLSNRGCEATELTHEEARRLVHRLEGEGRHGLCIVTNEAARHVCAASTPEARTPATTAAVNQSSK